MISPRQSRSRESTRRIVDAAIELLHTRGVREFSMSTVAANAGMSIGGVYGRFAGREDLLLAVKEAILAELEESVRSRLSVAPPGLTEVVGAFVAGFSEPLVTAARLYSFVFSHSAGDSRMRHSGFAFHARVRGLWVTALGPFDRNADALAVAYELVVQGLLMRVLSLGSVETPQELFPGFVDPDTYVRELGAAVSEYLRRRPA